MPNLALVILHVIYEIWVYCELGNQGKIRLSYYQIYELLKGN